MQTKLLLKKIKNYCPIIIDIETSGLNSNKNAILEIALINIQYKSSKYIPNKILNLKIMPFINSKMNNKALYYNKINPFSSLNFFITENLAINYILDFINKTIIETKNKKCIFIGHNCWFDLMFFNKLIHRTKKTNNYYHQFTIIDTATLGYLLYKQTILSKIAKNIGINFNNNKQHSAIYDAKITALIFCHIINKINLLKN